MQMQMRDIILLAITVAAVIIIVRTIMYMPLMQRAVETFVGDSLVTDSSGTPQNTLTECPVGSQVYVYDGIVYCCEGIIDPDANTVQRSCRAGAGTAQRMLCTLGPDKDGVVNCLKTRGGQMQEAGENICPPTLPNYCKGPTGSSSGNGRCCGGDTNVGYTDCLLSSLPACDVSGDSTGNILTNYFLAPTDCRFLRAAQLDTNCPVGYSHNSAITGVTGFKDATLIGCSIPVKGGSQYCYTPTIIGQLTTFGYDTSALPNCNTIQ